MTLRELANAVRVSQQTIGLIEKGEFNPSLWLSYDREDIRLDELFWEG